jgi:ectoine hydroxylase-related dioxygenase (phytanoyl-CoA dioxygenase family)
MLSPEGYALVEGVFGAGELDALGAALAAVPGRSRAGVRHLMAVPAVAALANDPRLLRLAAGGVPYRATLFEKAGTSNWQVAWHQDVALPLERRTSDPAWGPWSTKGGLLYARAPAWALERITALRVHLDASGEDNGPLRVLPGTHRLGVLSDEAVLEVARGRASTPLLAGRGAVVRMSPLLIHASSKSTSPRPRRVLHLEYADRRELAAGLRLARA